VSAGGKWAAGQLIDSSANHMQLNGAEWGFWGELLSPRY